MTAKHPNTHIAKNESEPGELVRVLIGCPEEEASNDTDEDREDQSEQSDLGFVDSAVSSGHESDHLVGEDAEYRESDEGDRDLAEIREPDPLLAPVVGRFGERCGVRGAHLCREERERRRTGTERQNGSYHIPGAISRMHGHSPRC